MSSGITDWDIQDSLKTEESRTCYLEEAKKEGLEFYESAKKDVELSLKIEKLSELAQEPSLTIPRGISREERRKFSKSKLGKI